MVYQSLAEFINGIFLVYAYFCEVDVGRSLVFVLYRRESKADPCGMAFLRHHILLHVPLPVMRIKLQFVTSSMIILTMCPSGSRQKSLRVEPWCHMIS